MQTHHRHISDLSNQTFIGYKGIGSNLGGLKSNESVPQGVTLSSKLQGQISGIGQLSEHASVPVMNTSNNLHQRFLSQGASQGTVGSHLGGGAISSSTSDMINMASFIQRQ